MGGQEKYLVSGNGGNAALGGYYFILPGGTLYSWNNNAQGMLSMSETTATFIANLGPAAYNDPTLLTNAALPYNPIAYSTEQTLDLQAPAPNNYFFNAQGQGEEYLVSGNHHNLTGSGYYILMPSGNLYAFDGHSLSTTLTGNPVYTLPSYYFLNPAWLIAATPPPSLLNGVDAIISGDTLTVSDTSFLGTAMITVAASDGVLSTTQSFLITFTDNAPSITTPSLLSQTVPFDQPATASFGVTATTGATLTLSTAVEGYSSLFNLEQQDDFQAPPGAVNYYFNARGGMEKYLSSAARWAATTSSCPAATSTPGTTTPRAR